MITLPALALCSALSLSAVSTATTVSQTEDVLPELTGGSNIDSGTLFPSGLPYVEFDFEDEDYRGTFPYEMQLEGTAEVTMPTVGGMTHSGDSALVYKGSGLAVITFSMPVERIEFYWRDATETVKSTVTGYDSRDEIVFRADGVPHSWGFVEYFSLTDPVMRLEFSMQSKTEIAVVDDLRIRHRETARNSCAGDGWSEPIGCPCGNLSELNSLEGCVNSTSRGARMHSLGSVSTQLQDLTFYVTGLPVGQPALLFEGEQGGSAIPFRDGLLCLSSVSRRLDVSVADHDGSTMLGDEIFVGPGKPLPGDVRDYQCWYRDPQLSPCGSGSNFSQAMRATWD